MLIHLHQTHQRLADLKAIRNYLRQSVNRSGLHLFPELFLTGYPLQDVCLQQVFIEAYEQHLEEINRWSLEQKQAQGQTQAMLLMGGLKYHFSSSSCVPERIENVVYAMELGEPMHRIYSKILLPSYDIFDERKYFSSGDESKVLEWQGRKIGITICEDMWPSCFYDIDPIEELARKSLDVVVNLSASPYHLNKLSVRVTRAKEISNALQVPMVYVNRVGAEDEILFDGRSFVIENEEVVMQGERFSPQVLSYELPLVRRGGEVKIPKGQKNTWEVLFAADNLHPLADADCEELLHALEFGISEYAQKVGGKRFAVAVSGGIDSALVLAIAKRAILRRGDGQQLDAIYMPSKFSSVLSTAAAEELCRRLEVKLHHLPIKFLHASARNIFADTFGKERQLAGLADENIQSRLRGTMLFAFANQVGALVLNTSNKSELAVGYSTLYGDSVGALSVLGDLYKTEVYVLADYLNRHHGELIPREIIERAPTAELRENQTDQMSLPPYERLDVMIEGILSYRLTESDFLKMGYPQEEIRRVFRLYHLSEFKRKQFPPILKVKRKSFGFGHRVPITKSGDFYFA
ncbi:MAG: NAD(+) synthase [Oligoflexia bacterium]|nr:NAD(+) synthase [Oligoflexia bacterium]